MEKQEKKVDIQSIINGEALIDDLKLSAPTHNILKRGGVHTLKQLLVNTEEGLMRVPLMREKNITEIKNKLMELGNPEIKLGFSEEKFKLELLKYYVMKREEFVAKISELDSKIGSLKGEILQDNGCKNVKM